MKTTIEEVKTYVDEHSPKWEAAGLPLTNWAWVGSTYINGEGDDIDIIVLTLGADIHNKRWADLGLVYGGSEPNGCDDSWVSTKDAMGHNVIFITDPDYYEKWCAAADTCRVIKDVYGFIDKDLRVWLHRIIMDDVRL